MDTITVTRLGTAESIDIRADISSLDVVAEIGDGEDALLQAMLTMQRADGEEVRRSCYLSESEEKVYVDDDVIAELLGSEPTGPAPEAEERPGLPEEEQRPVSPQPPELQSPGTSAEPQPAAVGADYYDSVDTFLQAQHPLALLCEDDVSISLPCDEVAWQRVGDREILASGHAWRFEAELQIDGVACGSHRMTVQEADGQYYVYLPSESLATIEKIAPQGVTGSGSVADTAFDYATVESYVSSLTPIEVRLLGDSQVARTYPSLRWTTPSSRELLPDGSGWVDRAELAVNGIQCGEHEITIAKVGEEWQVFVGPDTLAAIDDLVQDRSDAAIGADSA